jgi:hypothetical protein
MFIFSPKICSSLIFHILRESRLFGLALSASPKSFLLLLSPKRTCIWLPFPRWLISVLLHFNFFHPTLSSFMQTKQSQTI